MCEITPTTEPRLSGRHVEIPVGDAVLAGDLCTGPDALGLVVFAHGSGSSRFSPRNRFVATVLREAGLGTLPMDLLTRTEEMIDERTAQLRFDIELLTARVVAASDWAREQTDLHGLPIGLFGSSTGAAAALAAAARSPEYIGAIVSRGGRPDLAGPALAQVCAPTLLIVGGDDEPVIGLNRRAMAEMNNEMRIEIIPGATHLFVEPGTLEQVAHLAADWFSRHFRQ